VRGSRASGVVCAEAGRASQSGSCVSATFACLFLMVYIFLLGRKTFPSRDGRKCSESDTWNTSLLFARCRV
jgi:hypothetical protein